VAANEQLAGAAGQLNLHGQSLMFYQTRTTQDLIFSGQLGLESGFGTTA